MEKTILNVVRHQGGKLRFGVINQEFLDKPKPLKIRIKGLTGKSDDIVVNPSQAYYKYGSIYSPAIHNWLSDNYDRQTDDSIWLLKFIFENNGTEHVYKFVGDSGYRKVPRKRILIASDGHVFSCQKNVMLYQFIWGKTQSDTL